MCDDAAQNVMEEEVMQFYSAVVDQLGSGRFEAGVVVAHGGEGDETRFLERDRNSPVAVYQVTDERAAVEFARTVRAIIDEREEDESRVWPALLVVIDGRAAAFAGMAPAIADLDSLYDSSNITSMIEPAAGDANEVRSR